MKAADAITRWCPFSRVAIYDVAGRNTGPTSIPNGAPAHNRAVTSAPGVNIALSGCFCLAGGCAVWEWAAPFDEMNDATRAADPNAAGDCGLKTTRIMRRVQ